MKQTFLRLVIPVALAALGGCATESQNESTAASQPSAATPSRSAASPSGTASSDMRGSGMRERTASARSGAQGAGEPGVRSVYYEFDRSSLSAEDRKLVEAHARYLRQHPDVKVRVEGNADERGSKEYNLALGQRRAESVSRVMGLLGVSDQRVEAVSYGEEKPKAEGHDEKSWAENRRSDILY